MQRRHVLDRHRPEAGRSSRALQRVRRVGEVARRIDVALVDAGTASLDGDARGVRQRVRDPHERVRTVRRHDDQSTARTEHPRELRESAVGALEMLDDEVRVDEVEARLLERELFGVCNDELVEERVLTACGLVRIRTDEPVDAIAEEAKPRRATATDVERGRAGLERLVEQAPLGRDVIGLHLATVRLLPDLRSTSPSPADLRRVRHLVSADTLDS